MTIASSQDSDEELQILFKEISVNCSSDDYIKADNNLATSEEVDVSAVD